MGFAALIPVAASLLGSMMKSDEKPQPQQAAPPSLGEIFATNAQQNALPAQPSSPFAPSQTIKVGGGGFNG